MGSTAKDRTREFQVAVRSVKDRRGVAFTPNGLSAAVARQSQFTQSAKLVGRRINETLVRLEQLTQLVKSSSNFDDRSAEISERTEEIRVDVEQANRLLESLQRMSKDQERQRGRQSAKHSTGVVTSLQAQLVEVSNGFKSVLEKRTEVLKEQQQRRKQFATQAPYLAAPMLHTMEAATGGDASGAGKDEVAIGMPMSNFSLQSQEGTYLEERATAVRNIQSTIAELGHMFQQLASLVQEQGEQIQRIDDNVADTEMNVEAAHGELLTYFESISSNRWLMIKIFAVLIVAFVVFVVFLA